MGRYGNRATSPRDRQAYARYATAMTARRWLDSARMNGGAPTTFRPQPGDDTDGVVRALESAGATVEVGDCRGVITITVRAK